MAQGPAHRAEVATTQPNNRLRVTSGQLTLETKTNKVHAAAGLCGGTAGDQRPFQTDIALQRFTLSQLRTKAKKRTNCEARSGHHG
jgi:hypothetical protein